VSICGLGRNAVDHVQAFYDFAKHRVALVEMGGSPHRFVVLTMRCGDLATTQSKLLQAVEPAVGEWAALYQIELGAVRRLVRVVIARGTYGALLMEQAVDELRGDGVRGATIAQLLPFGGIPRIGIASLNHEVFDYAVKQ